jgi:PAS domain S-box-containing protein
MVREIRQVGGERSFCDGPQMALPTNDRPRAEQRPHGGSDCYMALLDDFPTPVWRSGTDGLCDYFNSTWLNFTGRSLEEELGNGWTDGVHPDDVERIRKEYRSAFDGRKPFTLEYRLRRHDGTYRRIIDDGRPYKDLDEAFAGYIGSCCDISERGEAVQALRESETRFRQLAENINKVFWLSNPEMTRIDYVSPAYEKIWARTCESLYRAPRSWLDLIHIADRERVSLAAGNHGAEVPFEQTYRIVREDGSIRWIHDRAFPVCDDTCKLVRIAGIAEDITERKQADDAIRTLLRISFKLNSTTDADRLMEFLAQEAVELIGTESGWAGVRQPEGIVVHSYLKNGVVVPLDYCWPPDYGLAGWQLEHQRPYVTNDAANDKQINPEMRERFGIRTAMNVPISDSKGQLLGCLQVNNKKDGTGFTPSDVEKLVSVAETASIALQNALAFQKIRQKEGEVSEAGEKLQLLSRRLITLQEDERRAIAYELHDGIGQTLSAIKIGLQTAQKSDDKGTTQRQLDDSVAMVDQLLQQVRQLALELRPSILDHLGLMPALRWYFDQQGQRAGLSIDFKHRDMPVTIPAEIQTACYRIAQEAMTNVFRHAKARHVFVELQELNGTLEFTISDDGVGFNIEEIELRASLGMAGMRERAAAGGGTFLATSSPGKGTTILVRLPLGNAAKAPGPA